MNEDSLHSDDMCQRNERLDNLESLESGESSVGSQMTLPTIHIPRSFQESALPDPPPLEAHSENLSITYHFGRSRRGSKQLISSDGYSYNVLRTNKNGTTKWQCVVRNKQIQCNAQVCQSGDSFVAKCTAPYSSWCTVGSGKKQYVSDRNLHSNIKPLQIWNYYCKVKIVFQT